MQEKEQEELSFDLSDIELLGNFDDNTGRYIIPDIIVKKLLEEPKYIDKIDGNKIHCSFSTIKNTYHFLVVENKNENDVSVARIYFIENFISELGEKTDLLTLLANCTTFKSENLDIIARRVFLLNDQKEKKKPSREEFLIDIYREEKSMLYKGAASELSLKNKEFVEDSLNILKDSEEGRDIIEELSKKLKNSKFKQGQIGYWLFAKKELVLLVKKNKKKLKKKQLEQFDLINNIFIARVLEVKSKFKKLQKDRLKKYESQLVIAGKEKQIKGSDGKTLSASTQVFSNENRETLMYPYSMYGIEESTSNQNTDFKPEEWNNEYMHDSKFPLMGQERSGGHRPPPPRENTTTMPGNGNFVDNINDNNTLISGMANRSAAEAHQEQQRLEGYARAKDQTEIVTERLLERSHNSQINQPIQGGFEVQYNPTIILYTQDSETAKAYTTFIKSDTTSGIGVMIEQENVNEMAANIFNNNAIEHVAECTLTK